MRGLLHRLVPHCEPKERTTLSIKSHWGGEMAQQIKAFVTKPDIIGTHIVEGENQLLQVILCPPHIDHNMCAHTHSLLSLYTYIHVKKNLSALGTPYLQLLHMAHYERSVFSSQG